MSEVEMLREEVEMLQEEVEMPAQIRTSLTFTLYIGHLGVFLEYCSDDFPRTW